MKLSDYKEEIMWGLIVGLVLFSIGFWVVGSSGGSYIPLKLLFPFMMLSTVFWDRILLPFIVLSFIQYPLYGLVIGIARKGGTMCVFLISSMIASIHFSLVYVCLYFGCKYF